MRNCISWWIILVSSLSAPWTVDCGLRSGQPLFSSCRDRVQKVTKKLRVSLADLRQRLLCVSDRPQGFRLPQGIKNSVAVCFQTTIIFYMPVWITNAENEVCPSSIRRGKGSWRSRVERKEHGEESLQACDREAMTSSFSPPYHLVLTRSQNTQLPTTKHKVTGSASKQSAYLT